MRESDCVRAVAEEILKGQILALGDPLSYSGIAIVPIVKLREEVHWRKQYDIISDFDRILDAIIGSLPGNTCGVFILDSLGDVLAFKFHQEVSSFWERIKFVEGLVLGQYKATRKPLGAISASSRVIAFLMRLKMEGTEGIISSEADFFAVSRTDLDCECKDRDFLANTAAVLYCAASQ